MKTQDERQEILSAIAHFEEKIKLQGIITNARDEDHLANLKQLLKTLDK